MVQVDYCPSAWAPAPKSPTLQSPSSALSSPGATPTSGALLSWSISSLNLSSRAVSFDALYGDTLIFMPRDSLEVLASGWHGLPCNYSSILPACHWQSEATPSPIHCFVGTAPHLLRAACAAAGWAAVDAGFQVRIIRTARAAQNLKRFGFTGLHAVSTVEEAVERRNKAKAACRREGRQC